MCVEREKTSLLKSFLLENETEATGVASELIPKILGVQFFQLLFERFLEPQDTPGRGKELVDCLVVRFGCIQCQNDTAAVDLASGFHDSQEINQAGNIAAGDFVHCGHDVVLVGDPMQLKHILRSKQFHSKSSIVKV